MESALYLKKCLGAAGRIARSHWFVGVIVLTTLFLYARTADFQFTNWDDDFFIAGNRYLKSISIENLKVILSPGGLPREQLYIPVTYASYLLEHAFFDGTSSIVHIDNLILHILNALLCYTFIYLVVKDRGAASLATALFAFHPIQVETVAWCMGRKDLLMALFVFTSLIFYWFYLRYEENRHGKMIFLLFSFVAFILGLLSKPSCLAMPLLLLGMALYQKKRLRLETAWSTLPFFLASVAVLMINSSIKANSFGQTFNFIALRGAFLPVVIQGWLARIFLIQRPQIMYLWHSYFNPDNIYLLPCLLLLIILAAAYLCFRLKKKRTLFFALFFIVFFLAPIGQVVYFYRDIITADRYGYLALAGIFGVCAVIAADRKRRYSRLALHSLMIVWVLSSIFLSNSAINAWRDSETLWETTIRQQPNNYIALYNLGNIRFSSGDYDKAGELYEKAISVFSEASTFYNLGIVSDLIGRSEKAVECFTIAALMEPESLKFTRKAVLLNYRDENYKTAMKFCLALLEKHPQYPKAYLYASETMAKLGDFKSAGRFRSKYLSLRKKTERNRLPPGLYNPNIQYPSQKEQFLDDLISR